MPASAVRSGANPWQEIIVFYALRLACVHIFMAIDRSASGLRRLAMDSGRCVPHSWVWSSGVASFVTRPLTGKGFYFHAFEIENMYVRMVFGHVMLL